MKQTALFIGFFLLLVPSFAMAQAQAPSCSAQGYTVVFVNGVFDSYLQAQADRAALENSLKKSNLPESVTVRLGYNPTHLAGLGDSAQSIFQQFYSSVTDFDLDTILMQIYPEVTTRKLLIVGHSQGADYANEMYDYLLAHGEPKDAVGVYAVATPASFVAGGGRYITSTNDKVINWVANGAALAGALKPLLGNVTLPLSAADQSSILGGHSFINDYLANAPTQITNDIGAELSALVSTDASAHGDCFTPPDASTGYKTQQVLFAIGDPTAIVLKTGGVVAFNAGAVALKTTATVLIGAVQFVSDAFAFGTAPPSEAQATQKTETIINKLYGSSLNGLSPQDKKDLLGGAAVLALPHEAPIAIGDGLVEGTSTGPATTDSTSSSQATMSQSDSSNTSTATSSTTPTTTLPAIIPYYESTTATAPPPTFIDAGIIKPSASDDATTTHDATSIQQSNPPSPPPAAISLDSFDSYDGSGWSTLHNDLGTYVLFTSDSTSGDCHLGNCIIANGGSGGLIGGGHAAYMFISLGGNKPSGALAVWGKGQVGLFSASGSMMLCVEASSLCGGQATLNSSILIDSAWHQYYMAWRQGTQSLEWCTLTDDINAADCAWSDTGFPLGTNINGVALTGFGSRPDYGDNVWMDELTLEPDPAN